jgi:hypothetical protein
MKACGKLQVTTTYGWKYIPNVTTAAAGAPFNALS